MYRNLSRNPVVFAGVLGAYFALGRVGLLARAGIPEAVTGLWPASGFALAALIIFGRPMWPAIFAGAFIEHAATSGQIAASVLVAIGATLEAVIGAALVDRMAGAESAFIRADSVFRSLGIAALVSTPLSAALATMAETLMGPSPWDELVFLFITGWLSHLCGILVVAPFLMLWILTPHATGRWLEAIESGTMLGLITVVGLVVFGGRFPSDVQSYPLEFLCMPLIFWAAMRLGRRQTATAVVVLSGIAVWGTMRGYGPFARDSAHEALILVQAYTAVTSITALVMAAAMGEHRSAREQLHELATTDPLTGLSNYRRLLEVLRTEIARSNRTKRPFTVLFVDMNGLKKINDEHGHLVGSRALTRIANVLRQSIRTIDTPARYGGDEFAVVLAETNEEGGRVVLERVFERLALDPDKPAISVSGGVAVYPRDGASPTQLLRTADRLLYDAKIQAAAARQQPPPPSEASKTGT